MGIYLYQHPSTGETKEIVQRMNEPHTYEENGVMWERIFCVPQAQIGQNIDPFSRRQFLEKTANKDSYGALLDRSKELSEKRAKMHGGVDPIRKKYEEDYSKKRGGRKLITKIGGTNDKTYEI